MRETFESKEKVSCKKKNCFFNGNYIFLSVPCVQYCTGTFEPLAYHMYTCISSFKKLWNS